MTNEELVEKYQNGVDKEKHLLELMDSNNGLLLQLARKYSFLFDSFEDTQQELFFVFYYAINNYDQASGAKFSTWLCNCSVKLFRESERTTLQKVPIYIRDRLIRYKAYVYDFKDQFRRNPTDKEIMQALELSASQLENVRKADKLKQLVWLDEPVSASDDELSMHEVVKSDINVEDDAVDNAMREDASMHLEMALDGLAPREKTAVTDHFYKEKSYKQIAESFDIDPDNVRKIIYNGMLKLRRNKQLKKWYLDAYGDVYKSAGFRHSHTSITERIAIRNVESRQKLDDIDCLINQLMEQELIKAAIEK